MMARDEYVTNLIRIFMKKLAIVLIPMILSISGCSTPLDYKSGTQVSDQQLVSFVKGKTTQTEVVKAIGQPQRKEPLNGKEIWYYDFNQVGVLFVNASESTVFEWSKKGSLIQRYKTGFSGKTGNALLDARG